LAALERAGSLAALALLAAALRKRTRRHS